MVPVAVLNVSTDESDYGTLVGNSDEPRWKSFPAPNDGVFAIAHPSKADECVEAINKVGRKLYVTWHVSEVATSATKADLRARAALFKEYHHFDWSFDTDRSCWTNGLLPIVDSLKNGAEAIISVESWQRLLQVFDGGSASLAAEELLDLMQHTLWKAELAASGRRRIVLQAADAITACRERLQTALATLGCGDHTLVAEQMSRDAWDAVEALAGDDSPAFELQIAIAERKIDELARFLLGDENAEGVIESRLRQHGREPV